jgi:hypothetical protein
MAGWVFAFKGGSATGEVIFVPPSTPTEPRSHRIGGLKFEDITINFSTGTTKLFYDWVTSALQRNYITADGAILEVRLKSQVIGQLSVTNALITGISFPTLDQKASDESGMRITLTPESIARSTPGLTLSWTPSQPRKPRLVSNFRVLIDGLGCSGVSRVESITIALARDAAGQPNT